MSEKSGGLEPACGLSPIKGGCGNIQALCVFFLGQVGRGAGNAGRTEGGQHTKAEEREPLIKGTSQFLSGKQALVKVYSGRRSFGKCELSCSFTALLQDSGKKVIMRRKGKKWQKHWEVGQRIPVRKMSVSLWVLG